MRTASNHATGLRNDTESKATKLFCPDVALIASVIESPAHPPWITPRAAKRPLPNGRYRAQFPRGKPISKIGPVGQVGTSSTNWIQCLKHEGTSVQKRRARVTGVAKCTQHYAHRTSSHGQSRVQVDRIPQWVANEGLRSGPARRSFQEFQVQSGNGHPSNHIPSDAA